MGMCNCNGSCKTGAGCGGGVGGVVGDNVINGPVGDNYYSPPNTAVPNHDWYYQPYCPPYNPQPYHPYCPPYNPWVPPYNGGCCRGCCCRCRPPYIPYWNGQPMTLAQGFPGMQCQSGQSVSVPLANCTVSLNSNNVTPTTILNEYKGPLTTDQVTIDPNSLPEGVSVFHTKK